LPPGKKNRRQKESPSKMGEQSMRYGREKNNGGGGIAVIGGEDKTFSSLRRKAGGIDRQITRRHWEKVQKRGAGHLDPAIGEKAGPKCRGEWDPRGGKMRLVERESITSKMDADQEVPANEKKRKAKRGASRREKRGQRLRKSMIKRSGKPWKKRADREKTGKNRARGSALSSI